jgi:CRISPR type III-B/RAMP module RAMP protein Cmr1
LQHLEVTFRLETPLYLAGANQAKAELRVPSIKGALRYWYRAIQPNLTGEGEIFGSMQAGQSALRLHLEKPKYPKPDNQAFMQGDVGPPYFAFSLEHRAYLPPDITFRLHLRVPSKNPAWKDYLASIWLLTAIGGLGSRSRRGYGSITWIHAESSQDEIKELMELLPKLITVDTKEEWLHQLRLGIQTLWRWFPGERTVTHTMIHTEMKLFLGSCVVSTWEEAMTKGATVLKNFRQGQGKAYFDEQSNTEIRASLGGAQEKERYPSPFWLRIVRIGKKYLPVYFLPKATLPDSRFQSGLELFEAYLCANGFRMEVLHS